MNKSWVIPFAAPLLVYVGICTVMWATQSRLIYFPDRVLTGNPGEFGLEYESLTLATADGESLHGWLLPAEDDAPYILFFHGNAGNISHRLQTLNMFRQLGAGALIIDYRGYGKSSGTPSESGTYSDATAAWRYLTESHGVAPARIIIFGRSLGGGIASWLAHQHPAAALILESTFTSVPDVAAKLYPWLPVRFLARIHYDTLSRLPNVTEPVFVIHSPEDETIPFEHGEKLYDNAKNKGEFIRIAGGHTEVFDVSRDVYVSAWRRIIDQIISG